MITRVVYNNKSFKIIDEYGFNFSNNEVTFNDIKIDFTGYTKEDIPYKYQEIKIMQAEDEDDIFNGTVLFTGYLDSIDISDMKLKNEEREMTLTLLSPLKLATKRNCTLVGTFELKTAIKRVLQPLIDDGFVLKEINIPDGQITVNYVLETVEYEMNDIGFKRNIFWYINEKKEIFVNSIDYLFGKEPVKTIRQDIKEEGLSKLQPEIENVDYANVINIKNIRLIYSTYDQTVSGPSDEFPIISEGKAIKYGDVITFDNPIIIDEEYLRDYIKTMDPYVTQFYSLYIRIKIGDDYKWYDIHLSKSSEASDYDLFVMSDGITYSNDKEEGEIVLQRDNFFSNLITGFKWNYDADGVVTDVYSDTALRYTTMRFMYSEEINKLKGVISDSGQIEKTIDYNEKWSTLPQLIDYARSLIIQNSNIVNQVTLEYDINPHINTGDIVKIEAPDFYIKGNFVAKDIKYTFINENDEKWEIVLKSSDLVSNYIDIFRPTEQQESTDTVNTVILSEFIEEEMNEKHELQISNQ